MKTIQVQQDQETFRARIASEEGSSIWKSDNEGYKREENVRRSETWRAENPQLPAAKTGKRK